MTPAELARDNAISFEAKKDSLRQMQNGDWRVAFTVQGIDMDARLSKANPGTRYVAVLVEINDRELPVTPAEKESNANSSTVSPASPRRLDKPAGAKRDWRDLQPAAQAGIRCGEPTFRAFLWERHGHDANDETKAAAAVRSICGVHSRVELGTKHAARVIWHQLDEQFQAWKALEHA